MLGESHRQNSEPVTHLSNLKPEEEKKNFFSCSDDESKERKKNLKFRRKIIFESNGIVKILICGNWTNEVEPESRMFEDIKWFTALHSLALKVSEVNRYGLE